MKIRIVDRPWERISRFMVETGYSKKGIDIQFAPICGFKTEAEARFFYDNYTLKPRVVAERVIDAVTVSPLASEGSDGVAP